MDCFVACAPRNDEPNVKHRGPLVEKNFMIRIAVGGFLHETNTFAPTKATYDDFVHGGGWPAMTQGADVLETMRGAIASRLALAASTGLTSRTFNCWT
jgi:hypothetical protein